MCTVRTKLPIPFICTLVLQAYLLKSEAFLLTVFIEMAAITIGLNNTEGNNRIRFENLSQRLQRINVDILHKVRDASSALEANNDKPDTGALGCFFQDELEQLRKLETAAHFKK